MESFIEISVTIEGETAKKDSCTGGKERWKLYMN